MSELGSLEAEPGTGFNWKAIYEDGERRLA